MNLEQKLLDFKEKITDAKQELTDKKAEQKLLMKTLKNDHGLNSTDDAEAEVQKLEKKQAKLEKEIASGVASLEEEYDL